MKLFCFVLMLMWVSACAHNTSSTQPASTSKPIESIKANNTTASDAVAKPVAPSTPAALGYQGGGLSSWQATANKKTIERFVKQTVDSGNKGFVPLPERVAVFDLDGTLWVERPQKAMMAFIHKELTKQIKRQPSLKNKQPWKSVARGDDAYLQRLNYSTLYLMLLKAHEGQSLTVYDYNVRSFFTKAKHPEYQKSYLSLAYQPMQELITYLQANQYQVYLVDSSDNSFVRTFSAQLFNVPVANVIGSSAVTVWREKQGELVRANDFVAPINNDEGKPVNIERHIGRRPVIAVGNDDSDLAMLQYSASHKGNSLQLVLQHDDATREYVYNDTAKGIMSEANKQQWIVISMKKDFKRLFHQ